MKIVLALLAFLLTTPALAQSGPNKYLSVAGTNSTLLRSGRTVLHVLLPINTTAVLYYLKLYDKATAPTCGTDVPKWTVPVPFGTGSTGSGVALPSTDGLVFQNGLGICITTGIADNDTGAAAAGIAVNYGVGGN